MGSTAKFGLLVLMALIIALARFLESEVKPSRAQTLTINRPAEPSSPAPRTRPDTRVTVTPTPVTPAPAPVIPAPAPVQPEPQTRTYTVKKRRGEVLSRISREVYGSQRHWRIILKANRRLLKGDPRKLRPGMVLTIPPKPE